MLIVGRGVVYGRGRNGSLENGGRLQAARVKGRRNADLTVELEGFRKYQRDGVRIPGSVRVLPDQVTEWAADRLRDQPYVLYCT